MEEKFKGSLSQPFSPDLKVLSYGGLCLAPLLSLAMLQYWWGRNHSRLLAGVAKIMLFVHCENWRPETDRSFPSPGDNLESLQVSLESQASALFASLWNRLFPSQKMGLWLQRSWNMVLILHICSEWQYGSHFAKMSSVFFSGWADIWWGFLAVYLVSWRKAFYHFGERMWVWGIWSGMQLTVNCAFEDIFIFTR